MHIIEYKRPLSGVLDEGEWWEQFTNLLRELGEEKSDAVRIEDASFDYTYGSIQGVHKQIDVYIDGSDEEEIFLAGFPKRLGLELTYILEDNILELADTDKVTASLENVKSVSNGSLVIIGWTVDL